MKKHYLVSRHNLTNCPACMSHITPNAEEILGCPFCGAEIHFDQEERPATFGGNVMGVLKSSRSAALAAMLGASLSMTACDLGEPDPEPDMSKTDMPIDQAIYGVPAVDMNEDLPDMPPMDQPVYGVPATDMDDEADLEPPAPAYGLPPQDMG